MKSRVFTGSPLAILLLLPIHVAVSAPIIWGNAATITADSDIMTTGGFVYGYNASNTNQTVNGVTFTGVSSQTAWGTGVSLNLAASPGNNTGAFDDGGWGTFGGGAAYKAMLAGASYNAGAAATVTLNTLASGHRYATQVWVNDTRATGAGRDQIANSIGGNTVTLDFNNTNLAGGVGQFATGVFPANATTQALTLDGSVSSQINAIQVRDVTNLGYWVGSGGATWDASTTPNFATNLWDVALATATFDVAKATLNSVVFADSYWNSSAATAVTQNSVMIAAGGVSADSVFFDNSSALAYTVTSPDANGITGSTKVNVTGGGTVTFAGTHSYTGGTHIGAGRLVIPTISSLAGYNSAGRLTVGNGGELSVSMGGGAWTAGDINDLLTANGAGFQSGSLLGIDTTGGSTTTTAAIGGSLGIVKRGTNTLTFPYANTYTGGTILNGGTLAYSVDTPGVKNLTFGATDLSTSVSALDLSTAPSNLTATGLVAQTNSASANIISIGAGKTLAVSGLVDIGASSGTTNLTLSGATGTFAVNNGGGATNNNFYIGGGGTAKGALDMSGLGTFSANLGTGTFAIGNGSTTGSGTVPYTANLAASSSLTATKVSVGAGFGNTTNSSAYTLRLGSGANTINTTDLYIGVYNNQGRGNTGTTLNFNATTGTLTLRGLAGGSTRANVHIGENQGGSTGTASGGSFNLGGSTSTDLSGGNADLLINALTISRRTAGSGDTSSMTFRSGVLDVNTLVMGNFTGNTGNSATGTLTLNGGTVLFNSGVSLGINTSGTGTGTATLNVAGATATATPGIVMGNQTLGTVNSTVNVSAGSLTLGGDITTVGTTNTTLTLSGGTLDLGGNDIGTALAAIDTFTINPGTAAELKNVGSINGSAGITKAGAGVLTLNANNYAGPTTINAGTVQIDGANDLGDGSATNTISLTASTFRSTSGTYSLGTNRAISLTNTNTILNDSGILTVDGVISGAGGLNIGSATVGANVTLSGNNLFTGNVSLPASNVQPRAVLTLTHSGALGVGPKTVTCTGGTTTQGGEIHLQNNITLASDIAFTTSGLSIHNDSGDNVINGNLSMMTGNGDTVLTSASGSLTLNGNLTAITTGRNLKLRGDGNGTISGVISNGTTVDLKVFKDSGAGTWTLSGPNTYTGITIISAGTLALGATGSITDSTGITLGAGSTLDTSNQASFAMSATQPVSFGLNSAGAGSSGRIVAADLDISAAVVTFNVTGTLDDPAYVLATYSSKTGAAFASVTPPSGYTIDYAYNGGTQIALVQVGASGYSNWLTLHPGLSDPSVGGDPENDGVRNLLEYVLNGDPQASDPAILPDLDASGSNFVFTFTRRVESATDTTQVFQYGSDLTGWTSLNITAPTAAEVTLGTPSGGLQSVTVTVPKGGNTKLFGRLIASQP